MDTKPLVTVIVPVYNAERYLPSCVSGILSQDYDNIELILVDDASSDGSAALAEELIRGDVRARLLRHEKNSGAGAARNTGIEAANGDFLLFLDADDLYEKDLVGCAVREAVRREADVVLYASDHFAEGQAGFTPSGIMLVRELLPAKRLFTAADVPEQIFQICTPEVWNKLFRRSFIEENGLRFQTLPNTNDLFFALGAVALGRISVVERTLIHYRVGAGGIQGSKRQAPLAFREALLALRRLLVERGLWPALEKSFVNCALFHINYNYRGMPNLLGGELPGLYREFGVVGRAASEFSSVDELLQYLGNLLRDPVRCALAPEEAAELYRLAGRQALEAAEESRDEIGRIHQSRSYRIGRVITGVPRRLREKTKNARGEA